MMKIGLGITTTPNRTLSPNIELFTNPSTIIFTNIDTEGLGVSPSRNNCLRALQDCDYIFLMDDDVYPIMSGWEQYFIGVAQKHKFNHFTLPESFKSNIVNPNIDFHNYDGCIGAFRMISKKCLETVGGFNSAYNRYGFEDAGYTDRVFRAGLNGRYKYPSPARAGYYIFSEDIYGRNPNVNISHKDKMQYIEANRQIYINELNNKLFYPYE